MGSASRTTMLISILVALGVGVLAGFSLSGLGSGDSGGSSGSSSGGSPMTMFLRHDLIGPSEDCCDSASGTNILALPYARESGLNDSRDLMDDINAGGGVVLNVQNFREHDDGWDIFDGSGTPFALEAGRALVVQMDTDAEYVMTGAHDPDVVLALEGPDDPNSASGMNFVALPFHSTASNAQDLIDQLGSANVESVQRYDTCTDTWETYSGGKMGGTNFSIHPGEGYMVTMAARVDWIPEHF